MAAWTLPPTRIRCGVTGLGASTFGGGGGGGAAVGTDPIMPPITPPPTPPGTPPGTPPTTPCTPEAAGNSSSLIIVISLGMAFGCISLPASNCRGITFTILGADAAGGGGGGGGGGGATRKLVNCVFGSASVKSSGIIIAAVMPTS